MANKFTAAALLEKVKKQEEEAAALRTYWESSLPVAAPSDFELKQLVRQFSLDYLVAGIDSYAKKLSDPKRQAKGRPATTANAQAYLCAVAWNKVEEDTPDVERPMTERRKRQTLGDPLSDQWTSEQWEAATPEERQKAVARNVVQQKARLAKRGVQ